MQRKPFTPPYKARRAAKEARSAEARRQLREAEMRLIALGGRPVRSF